MLYFLSERLPETIAETVDSNPLSVVNDLVTVLFENNAIRFLKASYIPVDGANRSLATFEIDAVLLDAEFRSAFRALPSGDDVVASHFRSSPISLDMVT
jgi:hypothetical protein